MRYKRYSIPIVTGEEENSIHFNKQDHMYTPEQMEERLWDFIDGLSSPAERSAIEELIAANLEWRQKYQELLGVHELMTHSELDAPSMRFTKNVMEEITRYQVAPATKTYINKNIIRSIGAFLLTLIIGFLVYMLGEFKWSSFSSTDSSSLVPKIGSLGLEKVNYGKVFNSAYVSVFMLIVVVLGLFMLDMYLQRKRNAAANP